MKQTYLERGNLEVKTLGRGMAWLDTGTHESLLEASQFVHTLEKRQGLKIACPEEVAWQSGWIDKSELKVLAAKQAGGSYRAYLQKLAERSDTNDGI